MLFNVRVLVISACIALPLVASAQIVNGGFEDPDVATFLNVPTGDSSLTGWTITSGNVDLVDAVGNGFVIGAAFDGTQYVDMNGTSGGTMSQLFATDIGTTYTLAFAYANNYSGSGSASAAVRVFDGAGDVLSPQTVAHSSSTSGNLNWTIFSATFTARQATSTLEFASLVPTGTSGVLIDGVSVTPVPEPASILAMSGLLIGMAKRKRSKMNA